MVNNIIFDMDDTLLKCGIYYTQATDAFVEDAHLRTQVPKDLIRQVLSGIDVACTTLPDGFNKERFPRSFAATSAVLDIIRGETVDDQAADQSYLIGASVFSAEYELFPRVSHTLTLLKHFGKNMFLCTKGDYSVQRRKIDKNALYVIFPEDHMYIVPKKNGEVITRIMTDHNLVPDETIVVGDSIRDDIGSAHAAGIKAVWVKGNNSKWAYENVDLTPDFIIDNITELLHEQFGEWEARS